MMRALAGEATKKDPPVGLAVKILEIKGRYSYKENYGTSKKLLIINAVDGGQSLNIWPRPGKMVTGPVDQQG